MIIVPAYYTLQIISFIATHDNIISLYQFGMKFNKTIDTLIWILKEKATAVTQVAGARVKGRDYRTKRVLNNSL